MMSQPTHETPCRTRPDVVLPAGGRTDFECEEAPTASAALAGKPKAGAPPALKPPTPGKLKLSELSLQSSNLEWMEELAKAGFGRNALSAGAGYHGASAGLKPGYQQDPKPTAPVAMPQTSMGDRAVITQAANKRVIPGAAGKVPGTVNANMAGLQNLTNKHGLAGFMARYKTRISGA